MAKCSHVSSIMTETGADGEFKTICQIPVELFEEILLYTSYDQIAQMRQVNKSFNAACSRLLNRGFVMVEKYHSQSLKRVKSQLPRRESERRNHALARHCDVLSAIETRLSLLSMTFTKFIDLNLCCFIPGKVIDEIYRVLRFINGNPSPPRVHELLQELRDISSMAMEYFEERVAPNLKLRLVSSRPSLTCRIVTTPTLANITPPTSRSEKDDESKIKKDMKAIQISSKRDFQELRSKLLEMEKRQKEQNQVMMEMQTRIADQELRIQELTSGSQKMSFKTHNSKTALSKNVQLEDEIVNDDGPCTRARSKKRRQIDAKSIPTDSKKMR